MKLTEDELFRGIGGIKQDVIPDRPEMQKGVHACIRCELALIPDESPRVLCYFCSKTVKDLKERT